MPGKFNILDGTGTKKNARVTTENALLVTELPYSAADVVASGQIKTLAAKKILSSRLVNSAGSVNMNVNGSVTPVEFSISAQNGYLRRITQLRIIFNGNGFNITTAESRKFSRDYATGLTNGLLFRAVQGGNINEIFLDPVSVIGDFYMYQHDVVCDIDAIASGIDFLMIVINLFPEVYLIPGETDKLSMVVRDDLSVADITKFQVFVLGSQEVL